MNPEFERNLHLEISLTRLISMPLFLATIFTLSFAIDRGMATTDETHYAVTANSAIGLYVLIVVLWGARQAAENLFEELRSRTWDTQKRTAISAWSLTWGKLFGSTIFNWYGGCLCWFVYALATPNPEKLPLNSLILFAGGVLAQGLSMLSAVLALRNRRSARSSFTYLLILFALLWAFPFARDSARITQIDWYGFQWSVPAFSAWTLALLAVWVVVGIHRLLAQELQIRTLPWVWLLFLGFLVFYGHGLVTALDSRDSNGFHDLIHAGRLTLLLCALFSYLQLFLDLNDPMLARRVWVFVQQHRWRRAAEEIPCWLINLAIALPIVLVLQGLSGISSSQFESRGLFAAAYLLMLRDTALILVFSYGSDPKRAQGLSLLWLILLYGILPWLLGKLHSDHAVALVLPLFAETVPASIAIAACQAGIAGCWLVRRWRNRVNRLLNEA